MRLSKLFIALAVSTALTLPVWAEEAPLVLTNDTALPQAASAPAPVKSAAAKKTSPKNLPASWDVKLADVPPSLLAQGQKIPCIATRIDPAGDIFRVSGGNEKIAGLWFTGKGLQLSPQSSVPVTVSFDGGGEPIRTIGLSASANTLIVNFNTHPAVYQQLARSKTVKILAGQGAGAAELSYRVDGITQALTNLEVCYLAQSNELPVNEPSLAMTDAADEPIIHEPKKLAQMATPPAPVVTKQIATKQAAKAAAADVPTFEISDEPFMPNTSLPGDTPVAPKIAKDKLPAMPEVSEIYSRAPAPDFVEQDEKAVSVEPPARDEQKSASTPAPALAPLPVKSVAPVAVAKPPQMPSQTLLDTPARAVNMPTKVVAAPTSAGKTNIVLPSNKNVVDSFRARKGEGLRDVMRRWAQRAGIDLVWTIQSDIVLEKDYSYVGNFKSALEGLLADYPHANINTTFAEQGFVQPVKQPYVEESQPPAVPPIPVQTGELDDFIPPLDSTDLLMDDIALAPSDVVMPPVDSKPPARPAADIPQFIDDVAAPVITPAYAQAQTPVPVVATQPVFGPTKRWRALQGASMREVLQAWADDAGVALVWQARQDYAVRRSYNRTIDYGQAVNQLLEQYMGQPGRPVGQLYQDPGTGQKALVVRSAG